MSREQVQPQLRAGADASTIKLDLRLSTLKPHVPNFCYDGWKLCADDKELVRAGWQKCGFLQAWDTEFQVEALDLHSKGELFPRSGTDEVPSGSEGEGSPPGSEGEAEDDSGDESDEGDADGISAVQDAAGSDHDALLTQIAARIAAQLEAGNEDRSAKKQRGRPKGSKNKPKNNANGAGSEAGRSQPNAGRGRGRSGARTGRP